MHCISELRYCFGLFVDVALYIMNHRLRRLKCNDVQYYLLTSDKDGDIELLLTDTVNAWHGCGALFTYSLHIIYILCILCSENVSALNSH